LNRSAQLRNYATEFVAQNHRDVDWPALRVVVLVNLTSADPNGATSQQHFIVCDFDGRENITQLHRTRLERVMDHRRHGSISHAQYLLTTVEGRRLKAEG
jgi:hypothetical protein